MPSGDIKKLTDRDHILKYPDAYLGSVHSVQVPALGFDGKVHVFKGYVPAAIRAFKEIADNSVDAAVRSGFTSGTNIHCSFNKDGFIVSDDGHGIPIKKGVDDLWMPELALGHARAGSNFDVDQRSTVGLYGVGSFVTNVVSDELKLTTCDGKKTYFQRFWSNARECTIPEIKSTRTRSSGTSVEVLFDKKIVKWNTASIACALQLLNNTMFVYPDIRVTADIDGTEVHLLSGDLFAEALGLTDEWCSVDIDGIKAVFGLFGDNSDIIGLVNGTHCSGVHVSTLKSMVSAAMIADLEKLIPGATRSDISKTMSGIISFRVYDPGFGSLTKTDLVSCDMSALKSSISHALPHITSGLLASDDFIALIGDLVEKRSGKKLKSREKSAAAKLKTTKLVDVYRDNSTKGETYLLITEGDSAKGLFLQARDSSKHAIYPLRGKILNTTVAKGGIDRVSSNAVLFELTTILGLSLSSADITSCRYDYIVSLTDADVDGDNISGLIYGYLRQYWPSLFDQGRVLRLCTPSHIIVRGNNREHYYGDSLPKKIDGRLIYIKGLGSLTLPDVKAIFADPKFEQMVPDEGADALMQIVLGEASQEKREWLG